MPPKEAQESQVLPQKEAALFRSLIKNYELKQYKKGVKTADLILKKFPNNGETQAMKGLCLSCLEKKTEAYELVKLGIRNNIRSHVCWHVYGLLYRADREYDEAIKCYKNALRMEKDNQTILRDLAQLQIQMRDLPGFLDTRQILLESKANNRQNWVALALAHHLNGNHEVAAGVLDAYEGILVDEDSGPTEAYELSEIMLYKVQVLQEGELFDGALKALDSAEQRGVVKDKIGAYEIRAQIYLGLQRYKEAEELYRKLLKLTTENHRYHDGLRKSLQLPTSTEQCTDATQRQQLTDLYRQLQVEYPKSTACRRMMLDFLVEQEFVDAADAYVRKYLAAGIPSLFSDLKPLYLADAVKAEMLGSLLTKIEASLTQSGQFPPLPEAYKDDAIASAAADSLAANGNNSIEKSEGGALVWTRLYLALHNDKLNNISEALRWINLCIADAPTLVEAHAAKSRILKHAGDPEGALYSADKARSLDIADRYINCVAVKAGFKAGQTDRAEATAALFTRDGEQNNNLFDMQATWYEIESGKAYFRNGDVGQALKRFLKIDSHFADFVEDQFDFHGYCVRKQTMRAYVEMLRMEDSLYSHKVYSKAMAGAVAAYLHLRDKPQGKDEEEKFAAMTPEEQKKYKQKQRKEELKRQKAAADSAKKDDGKAQEGTKKKTDPDPFGLQLIATPQPLEEATKLVRKLVDSAGDRLQNQLLAYEVYSRKGKLLLALKAVKSAVKLAGVEHPDVHRNIIRFAVIASSNSSSAPQANGGGSSEENKKDLTSPVVDQVLEEGIKQLLGNKTPAQYHATWLETHAPKSMLHRAAGAEMTALLDSQKKASATEELLLSKSCSLEGVLHKDCVAVYELLSPSKTTGVDSVLSDEKARDAWKVKCGQHFPYSRVFGGSSVVELEPLADLIPANGPPPAAVTEKLAALSVKDGSSKK